MTCPLDPKKYPVLQDESCEVKVILGKDQHTSVSISGGRTKKFQSGDDGMGGMGWGWDGDGLFNGNFNPRTSFSSFLFCHVVWVVHGFWFCCCGFCVWTFVCLHGHCPEHVEHIGCTSKGSAQICFFFWVFVFMSLFWMLNDICDVCLNSWPFCVWVLFFFSLSLSVHTNNANALLRLPFTPPMSVTLVPVPVTWSYLHNWYHDCLELFFVVSVLVSLLN